MHKLHLHIFSVALSRPRFNRWCMDVFVCVYVCVLSVLRSFHISCRCRLKERKKRTVVTNKEVGADFLWGVSVRPSLNRLRPHPAPQYYP